MTIVVVVENSDYQRGWGRGSRDDRHILGTRWRVEKNNQKHFLLNGVQL
jgi:hypothetical protein